MGLFVRFDDSDKDNVTDEVDGRDPSTKNSVIEPLLETDLLLAK